MYNSFIHEQRITHFRQQEQSRLKEYKWQKHYHTQIQPYLLDHYDKRINSFVHHVGERPILMNPEKAEKGQEKKKSLVFRNDEDWKSVYNTRQREEIKQHQKFISLKNMRQTGKIMPTAYQTPMRQYRSRSKQLEIHPPMRYKNQNRRQSTETIEIIKRKPNLRELVKAQRIKEKDRNRFELENIKHNFNSLINTHHSSHTSKNYEEEDGDFLRNDKTQNIEVQARIYQKQREIVEKKLHFKKLMDMAIKNPVESNRREYKSILERCGLLGGRKRHIKSQTTELDKFTSMVETADRQKQKQNK